MEVRFSFHKPSPLPDSPNALDESYPRIQPTTGRKAVDLLTVTHVSPPEVEECDFYGENCGRESDE